METAVLPFDFKQANVLAHYDCMPLAMIVNDSANKPFFGIAVGPSEDWPGENSNTWIMCIVPMTPDHVRVLTKSEPMDYGWSSYVRALMREASGYYLEDLYVEEEKSEAKFFAKPVPEDFKPMPDA